NVVAKLVRKLLSKPRRQSPPPHCQGLPQKLNSAKCQHKEAEQSKSLFKRTGVIDRIQHLVRERTSQINGNKAEPKADNHRNPNQDDWTLVRLEIDDHSANGFPFAHASRANL